MAYSFPSVILPLVTFRENYFLGDTLQFILVLMIPVSNFYHVRGPRKREVRHTDRQTHRQTDTQTDRHTDRQTDTQTDRHTDRQTDRRTDRFWILLYR